MTQTTHGRTRTARRMPCTLWLLLSLPRYRYVFYVYEGELLNGFTVTLTRRPTSDRRVLGVYL